jgi:hypothetical protein
MRFRFAGAKSVRSHAPGSVHGKKNKKALVLPHCSQMLVICSLASAGARAPSRSCALVAQRRPGLPIALAMKGAGGENATDLGHRRRVRHGPFRPGPPTRRGRRVGGLSPAVDPRRGDNPVSADAGEPVAAARGDREHDAHGFDLHRPKGRPASIRSLFSCRSSRSIVT